MPIGKSIPICPQSLPLCRRWPSKGHTGKSDTRAGVYVLRVIEKMKNRGASDGLSCRMHSGRAPSKFKPSTTSHWKSALVEGGHARRSLETMNTV